MAARGPGTGPRLGRGHHLRPGYLGIVQKPANPYLVRTLAAKQLDADPLYRHER